MRKLLHGLSLAGEVHVKRKGACGDLPAGPLFIGPRGCRQYPSDPRHINGRKRLRK